MANSLQHIGGSPSVISVFGGFSAHLAKFGSRIASAAASTLRTMQTGRMMSVLSAMSDEQLAQIGISRSEIPKHAEKLISGR